MTGGKVGRPGRPGGPDPTVSLRVPRPLLGAVDRAAGDGGRSEWIVAAMSAALTAPDHAEMVELTVDVEPAAKLLADWIAAEPDVIERRARLRRVQAGARSSQALARTLTSAGDELLRAGGLDAADWAGVAALFPALMAAGEPGFHARGQVWFQMMGMLAAAGIGFGLAPGREASDIDGAVEEEEGA
jgi:hypothetical protein